MTVSLKYGLNFCFPIVFKTLLNHLNKYYIYLTFYFEYDDVIYLNQLGINPAKQFFVLTYHFFINEPKQLKTCYLTING